MKPDPPVGLAEDRFPVDEWRLVETAFRDDDLGWTETIFAVGNGYLGMRANPEEGREAATHGTFVNGFHETWSIRHAEDAFGLARIGQTIVNVPDPKVMKLYVDDEPLTLSTADLESYERVLDFRTGTLTRDLVWRTPAGKRVRVRSSRLVSLVHRHVAVLTLEVTMLDGEAPVVISSQLVNREDGLDEYTRVPGRADGSGGSGDPRRARTFDHRVLVPQVKRENLAAHQAILGYRCAASAMTLACGYRHLIDSGGPAHVSTTVADDLAKTVVSVQAGPGRVISITKLVTYHTSTGVPADELADRCVRTLDRTNADGIESLCDEQAAWLDEFWKRSDVVLHGTPADQQAARWNLFQLAQATAQAQEQGVAAKGVTGAGYEGQYFWDTEMYVVPFLAYTNPQAARSLLRFRWRMLDHARQRASELHHRGALYPWRTINGLEASAYYAAGTAQYHIDADIAFAIKRYLDASGDVAFVANEGAEMLVETARLWEDLGFFGPNGDSGPFHIHGVTGPDEYTTVVNDNLYTNVMARFNMRYAADVVELLRELDPVAYERLSRRVGLRAEEVENWRIAAEAMYVPYDADLGIHPQDDTFLDREVWDFADTPGENYPLLLHYHPLEIYRHQVLKQCDVVFAMVLQSEEFDLPTRRRDFDYYDPITTGDSSLSACVQALAAAQIGYPEKSVDYFREALYVDLSDTHGNTADGVHVASAGGVWGSIVFGFAGLYEAGEGLRFAPSLPARWPRVTFRIVRRESFLEVDLDQDGATVTVIEGEPVPVFVNGGVPVKVAVGDSVRIGRVDVALAEGEVDTPSLTARRALAGRDARR